VEQALTIAQEHAQAGISPFGGTFPTWLAMGA
jgi:hypothetical protein